MNSFRNLSGKARKSIRRAATAFALAAVLAGSAAFGYLYIFGMRQSLWNQLVENVIEVTHQGGYTFETYITKEREIVDRLKRKFINSDPRDGKGIMEILNTYTDDEGIFSFVSIAKDGTGKIYFAGSDEVVELTAKKVEEQFKDYRQSGVTEPYLNTLTGQRTIGYYEKITLGDGTTGIVSKGQLLSTIKNKYSLSFFDNTGFSYIVNAKGDIMIRPSHKNSNRTFSNLFDIIMQNNNSKEDVRSLMDNMQGGKSGAVRLNFNGERHVFAFTPVAGTDGWYIVSIIPDASISGHADDILQSTQNFILIIAVVIVLVLVFVFITYFYRKKIEEKQREVIYREQLFDILANNTNDVFIMGSPSDYSLNYVSPNAERLLGIPAQTVRNDISVLRTGEDGKNHEATKTLPETGSLSVERQRTHKKTGEPRYFYETVYRESIDGKDKFIAVLSDRTEDKKEEEVLKNAMESAQAANKAKSAFLSNMSHDIRTPMNAILGFTELIKRDSKDPDKVMQYTNKIYSSGQYLLGLINDVLDMSKIESGKIVLNISEINLAEFVEEIAVMMRPQARMKNQELEIFVRDVREESLLGDKLRLNQILINILSNAVKYTPQGGRIEFDICELPHLNENFAHIRFTISDNGIGMTEDYLKTIFDPFTRETSSTVNKIQGTGLGMAITKNLVELMGGTINVESAPGKGSTFTVELELRIDEEDVNNEFWQEFGIRRTLVVDDEEDVCHNVSGILADVGLDSHYAMSGEEAVEIVEKFHSEGKNFDLILLDMRMPGMNGIETARKIREIASKEVSILILTSYDWTELEESAHEAGIDAFLPKPFFVSNLKLNIRKLKETKTAEEKSKGEVYTLEGKHFLAAEDNEINAEILVELLNMIGITCDVAENGRIAVEKFEQAAPGTYDAVLMDIQMPVMNGYEATKAIRSGSHPNAKNIPIIAMTANAFAEDINNALAAGMDAHVAKPVDIKHLESVLKELISKKADGTNDAKK